MPVVAGENQRGWDFTFALRLPVAMVSSSSFCPLGNADGFSGHRVGGRTIKKESGKQH